MYYLAIQQYFRELYHEIEVSKKVEVCDTSKTKLMDYHREVRNRRVRWYDV